MSGVLNLNALWQESVETWRWNSTRPIPALLSPCVDQTEANKTQEEKLEIRQIDVPASVLDKTFCYKISLSLKKTRFCVKIISPFSNSAIGSGSCTVDTQIPQRSVNNDIISASKIYNSGCDKVLYLVSISKADWNRHTWSQMRWWRDSRSGVISAWGVARVCKISMTWAGPPIQYKDDILPV